MAKAVYLKKGNEKYYPVPYFPVGSIYLSINKTNPQSLFGGTWELVGSGKYLMGYDPNNHWFNQPGKDRGTGDGPGNWDTYGHVLTTNEIPSHSHTWNSNTSNTFETLFVTNGGGWAFPGSSSGYAFKGGYANIGNSGGGQAHSHFHVSPYYTVCVWLRTA